MTDIANIFTLDDSLIESITTDKLNQPAKRPLRGGLVTFKASNDFGIKFRGVESGILLLKNFYNY